MYKFLSHLKNIVYIVFGVKPDLTFNIIRQWMEMEANMSLITGKFARIVRIKGTVSSALYIVHVTHDNYYHV